MNYDMGQILGNMGGSSSNYSMDEIEAAKKRQKIYGGTIVDNLEAMRHKSGKSKPVARSIDETLKMTADDITKTLRDLNSNLETDFNISGKNDMSLEQAGKDQNQTVITDNAKMLEGFGGMQEALKEKIYGQDDFIKKLVIAFKRPYVSELDSNDALNSIFITGPECTGKHFALECISEELGKRHILACSDIYTMNLSLYPTAAEDKLFLQDLYSALQSKAAVLVFENYENCHVSMLTRLSDLVTTGECRLSERYIMQKGQLVSVSNALAGETVGSFEASGKYFVFVGRSGLDKLAGVMGAPFVNALGDVCETKPLDDESLKKISESQEAVLIDKCKKQLAFDITVEDSFREYMLSQSSKNRGLRGILDAYADTLKALAQLKLESDDASSSLTLICEEGEPIFAGEKEKMPMSNFVQMGYSGEVEAVEKELDNIVGLDMVKDYIRSLKEYYAMQKRRREEGLKAGELNKHMIFTGNPGTGKTTIARIVSKYLKAIGVLSGGQLVEVSRGDLVGRYAGHTAPLVNQVVKSALGGVLFIDEAYSLYRGEDDSFGLEAIDTLVKCIEDNRDNLIVILAGYSKEMEDFLESNSGLKSRFPNIIDFPDYTGEELVSISKITAKSKGYEISDDVIEPLLAFFENVQATNAREAGNGRLVRNKVEEAILNQSKRLVAEQDADMSLLTRMDFDL